VSQWPLLLEQLIRERGRALHGYAFLLTGSMPDAEDLVQDALTKVFSRQYRLREINSAEAYVRRTIRTLFLDDRRRHRHSREVLGVTVDGAPPADSGAFAARATVHAALLTLPPRERLCIVMRFYDDLPYADVGAQLGINAATVRGYVHGGIQRLGAHAESLGLTPDLADSESEPYVPVLIHKEA